MQPMSPTDQKLNIKNQSSAQILHSNDDVHVVYQPGRSDFLLVTFSPLHSIPDGLVFWGDRFAAKNDIASIGFIAKKENWYPREGMLKAILNCKNILERYDEIITYGSSMGGTQQ